MIELPLSSCDKLKVLSETSSEFIDILSEISEMPQVFFIHRDSPSISYEGVTYMFQIFLYKKTSFEKMLKENSKNSLYCFNSIFSAGLNVNDQIFIRGTFIKNTSHLLRDRLIDDITDSQPNNE